MKKGASGKIYTNSKEIKRIVGNRDKKKKKK